MCLLSFLVSLLRYRSLIKQFPNAIVLFSEGNSYSSSNTPIIEDLLKKETVLFYLTLDPKDSYLSSQVERFYPFLMSLNFLGVLFLKLLNTKLFITTTPGLGSLQLKKSKYVTHYSYFMHSPTDIHRYQKFSFDCFDSIVCSGEFQIKTLEHLEKTRNFPKKEKIALGVPYYDIMIKEFDSLSVSQSDSPTILIAPSWGNSNFLNYYRISVIGDILSLGYNVIMRFHPQSYRHEADLIKSIEKLYGSNIRFQVDKNVSNVESIKKSNFLISSYSGIIFDFIFLTEKPCIVFDLKKIGSNFEDKDIPFASWEEKYIPKIGKEIALDTEFSMKEVLTELNAREKDILLHIKQAKEEIVNFGNCSDQITSFYLDKIKDLS